MSNIKRWKLIADNCIMAKSDLSVFKHRSTIIAKETREFFSLNNLEPGHSVNFTLVFNNAEYSAKVEHLKSGGQQTRIIWGPELKQEIDKNFPNVIKNETYPYMKFIKLGDKKFQLAFFSDNSDENEVPLDLETEIISEIEGRKILYYVTKYERSKTNRLKAIEIHGLKCMACGFDFNEFYGERGANYIEVHHIVPLSSKDEEVVVNPATDLVCVCSNCHRMIHSRKNSILNIDDLKCMIENQRKKQCQSKSKRQ